MENFSKHFEALNKICYEIPLEAIMSKPVIKIFEDDDFSLVEEKFIKHRIRHLPVVDHSQKLVGMISQKDVYRHIAPRRSPEGRVVFREDIILDEDGYYEKEALNSYITNIIMHRDPIVLTKEKTFGDAIHLMVINKIGSIPIVDEKMHVIGILARFDVLKLLDNLYEIK